MKKIFFVTLLVVIVCSPGLNAAARYWTGAADNNWSNTNNWSTTSGGTGGASVPGSGDVANFDANGLVNCTLDATVNVAGLTVTSGYTMTITQSTNTITIGTSGATLSGGTFAGGSANIAFTGSCTISGCAFTSTSGTFTTNSNFTFSSGSFTHNSGTMKFTATCTITGSVTMNNLKFSPTGNATYTIASGTTLTVDANLYFENSTILVVNTGTISVKKDVYASNTGTATTGGTATIKLSGSVKQTIYGHSTINGPIPNVEINKTDTVKLVDVICIGGSFTYTSGVVDAGTSTVVFKDAINATISGSCSLYAVIFYTWINNTTYTIASGTILTVNGSLTTSGDKILTINTGTIHVKANCILNNSQSSGGGNALLVFNGSGTQTLTGSSTAGNGPIPSVQINKSSTDTLKLVNCTTVKGNWTFTAGIISAGTSEVRFYGTKTITGSHTLYNMTFTGAALSTITIASGTTVTVTGTLAYISGQSIVVNTGTIDVKGNINDSNTGGGSGTATIRINGTGNQSITGSASSPVGALPNVEINKSSGTLSLSGHITVAGNWTYVAGTISPGTSTVCFWTSLTITGSHTLKNVTFSGSATSTYTIASGTTLTVDSTLTITGSNVATINTGTINAKGNISHTSNVTSGTAGTYTLVINGTGDQTFTGSTTATAGRINSITINKSSGTLTLANWISVYGNFTYTAGTISPGSSTVNFVVSKNISGNFPLNNVIFNGGYTYSMVSSSTITASGEVKLGGTSPCIVNGAGAVNCQGDLTITNTSTGAVGNQTFVINGTGSQTFTGSGVAGQGRISNVTIDKVSGTLTLASVISCAGNWIYAQGSVSAGTSTVVFYGDANLDGKGSVSPYPVMQFYRIQVAGGMRTLTGDLYCLDNLAAATGTTLAAGTNDITIKGNWKVQGTWSHGNDTVNFIGSNYNRIEGPGGQTINFAHVTFNRRGGSATLINPVTIDSSMTLSLGRIKTTTTNYLQFGDNAKCYVLNNDSAYVCGPVRKVGNDAFKFPLGDTLLHDSIAYHPLEITAPGNVTDNFQAQYLAVGQAYGDSIVDTLSSISDCEYWLIERIAGTSSVYVSTHWNKNSCNIQDYDGLSVANWDGNKWVDLGAGSVNITGDGTGYITSVFSPNFSITPSPIVIGRRLGAVPYATLQRKLDGGFYYVGNGALRFVYDEEYSDSDNRLNFTIYTDYNYPVATSAGMPANLLPSIVTRYGDNRYTINIAACNITSNGYLPSGYYILEVVNEKNEKRYLRFKHTNTIIYNNCNPNNQGQ